MYQQATDIAPHPLAYANWGYALNHLGQYEEAIDVLNKSIDLELHDRSLTYRAHALRKLNRTDEAMSDYDEAMKLNPGNMKLRTLRAELLDDIGRKPEAYSETLFILKHEPSNVRALRLKARLQNEIGPLGL
jgi:tetratricopeptide (TPR) repeat protein